MSTAPFTYPHPLGNASPQAGLIAAPSPEIGNVMWGYSTVDRSAPPHRPWWHPMKNPILTGGLMAFTLFVAMSALREGAGVSVAIIVIGYLVTKGIGAFVGAGTSTNFFVGEHGMDDVSQRKGETARATFLWKDIAWWGATPERFNGRHIVRHVQLDPQLRLLNHVNPFGFRFNGDPSADPESAMYAAAQRAWLAAKVAEVSHRLANGEAVDMPLLATQNAGRLATGTRPGSYVRVSREHVVVAIDGRPVFQAPRAQTVLTWEHRPSPIGGYSQDVHCVLTGGGATWSTPRYEFPAADVLAAFVRPPA